MYHFHVVKKDGTGHSGEIYEAVRCTDHVVTEDSLSAKEGLKAPGVYLDLVGGPENYHIELPRDGEAVYVMNDAGKTIKTYRWPLDRPEKVMRTV